LIKKWKVLIVTMRLNKCPKCQKAGDWNGTFDLLYCNDCNIWIDKNLKEECCSDPKCIFRENRMKYGIPKCPR
jgi:hypothetical protein